MRLADKVNLFRSRERHLYCGGAAQCRAGACAPSGRGAPEHVTRCPGTPLPQHTFLRRSNCACDVYRRSKRGDKRRARVRLRMLRSLAAPARRPRRRSFPTNPPVRDGARDFCTLSVHLSYLSADCGPSSRRRSWPRPGTAPVTTVALHSGLNLTAAGNEQDAEGAPWHAGA